MKKRKLINAVIPINYSFSLSLIIHFVKTESPSMKGKILVKNSKRYVRNKSWSSKRISVSVLYDFVRFAKISFFLLFLSYDRYFFHH